MPVRYFLRAPLVSTRRSRASRRREWRARISDCRQKHATGAESGGVPCHTLPVWSWAVLVCCGKGESGLRKLAHDVT